MAHELLVPPLTLPHLKCSFLPSLFISLVVSNPYSSYDFIICLPHSQVGLQTACTVPYSSPSPPHPVIILTPISFAIYQLPMAPISRRPRPPKPLHKPTSEILIDQDQSLELVRTVMTATVRLYTRRRFSIWLTTFPSGQHYCLVSVRFSYVCQVPPTIAHQTCSKIFPRDRYAIRVYDYADPETSYESFMNGTHGKDFDFERSGDVLAWKVLTRNSDPAVNKLLDWLVSPLCRRRFLN